MSKIILAIVVLAAVFHSFECLTQGAGALVGKRAASMMAREKKFLLGRFPGSLEQYVSCDFYCFQDCEKAKM